MKKNTQGAWIIHDTLKLQEVQGGGLFDEIDAAGKCGLMLSALAESDNNATIKAGKVKTLARAAGVGALELNPILDRLRGGSLIDVSRGGDVSVLGLTTPKILEHTADLFRKSNPTTYEIAAIELSEKVSQAPMSDKFAKEYVADSFKLSGREVDDLIQQAEDIGFVDSESLDREEKLLFNGNLFRRDHLKKTKAVLDSLSPLEVQKVTDLDDLLIKEGCIPLERALLIAGQPLLEKLQSIGMFDFNEVVNDEESRVFLTKPSAFSKFGNPFAEDAFDLAKAFVASLSYGMIYSSTDRGRISALRALLKKLIAGHMVGPATAIGQDYNILELKGVVKLVHYKGSQFWMKLLKRDIGVLALHVLESGDASEHGLLALQGSSVTGYHGPEFKRMQARKKRRAKESRIQIVEALRTLRQE